MKTQHESSVKKQTLLFISMTKDKRSQRVELHQNRRGGPQIITVTHTADRPVF